MVCVYLSEIFPSGIREKGQSLGTLALWLANGLVAGVYPKIASVAGQYPFFFFSTRMVLQLFLTLFVFPKTKGLSLETSSERLFEANYSITLAHSECALITERRCTRRMS